MSSPQEIITKHLLESSPSFKQYELAEMAGVRVKDFSLMMNNHKPFKGCYLALMVHHLKDKLPAKKHKTLFNLLSKFY